MDFSFFTTDNKSGYKTNEKWLLKNYPQVHEEIVNYCKNINIDISFKEKIYFYFHKMTNRPSCLCCGDEVKFRNRYDKPYGDFCSLSCANNSKEELVKRQKETINKKYGVDFYTQHKDFVKKQKETKLKLYGNANYNNIEKVKKTKELTYGTINYNNIDKQKLTCLSKYGVDNYAKSNKYKEVLIKEYTDLYPNIDFIDIKKGWVVIKCPNCNTTSELTKQLIYERNKRNQDVCLTCNPLGQSKRSYGEKEICEFLDLNNIKYVNNFKIKDTKQEIDIYLPDYNLGIEFNGLYWHNELFRSPEYHLDKTIKCEKLGINLIHIFEDEWLYKKDIVMSILKNKLNIVDNRIYGRKCVIKPIDNNKCKSFLDDNHIQGNVNSNIKLGLYYGDELVSVMTFSKGRVILGGKPDEWELNRFCNKLNTVVIGAASKLLNHFINEYKPQVLISYSDIRLFDGQMYNKLNFKWTSQSPPNYWYVVGDKRHYRFNFNKKRLVKEGYDQNKTEKQIMFDRGIYRIYDCGNIRWVLNVRQK